jgi:hypothetical protein
MWNEPIETHRTGYELVNTPMLNKGTAFSAEYVRAAWVAATAYRIA